MAAGGVDGASDGDTGHTLTHANFTGMAQIVCVATPCFWHATSGAEEEKAGKEAFYCPKWLWAKLQVQTTVAGANPKHEQQAQILEQC